MRRPLPIWLLLLPLLAGGCVTHKLWTDSNLDEWNEPASNPNLRLFRDEKKEDFLVVYDEFVSRSSTTNTRAYYLRQNLEPLSQNGRPHFVCIKKSRQLMPVPVVFLMPTNSPEFYFAITTTNNNQSFALFRGDRDFGEHSLPSYNDGKGRWERIAWTPLTVTADLTVVGGCLAIICWEGLAQSGTQISVR